MDAFTENILTRARERQKLLEEYSSEKTRPLRETNTETPNNKACSPPRKNASDSNLPSSTDCTPVLKENLSEGNIPHRYSRQNSKTQVSSHLPASPQSKQTINIQKDNFNMEIKVTSSDDVRVEVEFEDELSGESEGGLREESKIRLKRLGKLYEGGDDAGISSPIHKSEAKFHEKMNEGVEKSKGGDEKGRKGLSKLADLAQTINQWEDEINPNRNPEKKTTPPKRPWKQPAPQPPSIGKASPAKSTPQKPKAPNPPTQVVGVTPKQLKWDKTVLDSLETQGFTRTTSTSRLVYAYNSQDKKVVVSETITEPPRSPCKKLGEKTAKFESSQEKNPALSVSERKALFEKNKKVEIRKEENKPKKPEEQPIAPSKTHLRIGGKIADKAAMFESSPTRNPSKDPALLSVSERTALFERIKGTALVPKAAFGMAAPVKGDNSPIIVKKPMIKEEIRKEQEEKEQESEDESNEQTTMIPPAPIPVCATPEKRKSGGKRGKADSPIVAAVLEDVKRIKVAPAKTGRLYPNLSDIEATTETETENAASHNNSSYDENSSDSGDANTSFARDIMQVVKNHTPQKRAILDESTESDLSSLLDEDIDEALICDSAGPTPPKLGRPSPVGSKVPQISNSFHYKNCTPKPSPKTPKTPKKSMEMPSYVMEGDNALPLTHTVSFYRKQQTQVSKTPVRQVSRQPLLMEDPAEGSSKEDGMVQVKINELQEEVKKQQMIISQTSQALNLCNCTPEFSGSTEQVEAEKVLLVATHRRHAAVQELQRLKVEGTLRPQHSQNVPLEKGTLTISNIVLPLKKKYVTALAAAGGKGHHVLCLVKCGEQVIPTKLVSTVASSSKNLDMELAVPGTITLSNVYSDFTVTFEVYCLQAQEEFLPHEVKYHIKTSSKLTPKKNKDSRLQRPFKESPAGPQAVRSPSFALNGYVVFSVQAVNKRLWTLNNTPSMSPLEGSIEMRIACELAVSVEHRGFLTMFEDISGFGAWHRRWCLLKGNTLSYWKYPDDERKMAPIDTLDLKNCITKSVGPVSRDICARLHTFLLERERIAYPQDKDTLVMICKGDKTVIRHLLSADTKEERIEWCGKFNAALKANQWGNQ